MMLRFSLSTAILLMLALACGMQIFLGWSPWKPGTRMASAPITAPAMFSRDGTRVLVHAHDEGVTFAWLEETGEAQKGIVQNSDFTEAEDEFLKTTNHKLAICDGDFVRNRLSHSFFSRNKFTNDLMTQSINHDHAVQVLDVDHEKVLGKLVGHTSAVIWIAFSHDENRIVTCGEDKTVRVWDAKSFKPISIIVDDAESGIALFSPDNRRILASESNSVPKIWDTETGVLLAKLDEGSNGYSAAVFAQDGKRIVVSGSTGIRVWNRVHDEALGIFDLPATWLLMVILAILLGRVLTRGSRKKI